MRRGHRWAIVVAGVLILAALPWAVSKLPAAGSGATATDLLGRVQRSSSVSYSGYAESVGSLALPATDQFNAITNLLGARTQMRVWWSSSAEWRVDTVGLSGETDLHQSGGQTWTWNYEANRATLDDSRYPQDVRLPRSDDLIPPNLARRLLSQATPDEVRRLPSVRVGGHDAAGLQVRPNEPESTIDRIDVWVLATSGLPVRVAVYGKGSRTAVVSTSFLQLNTGQPRSSDIDFTPPLSARVEDSNGLDLLGFIDLLGNAQPPATLAGLTRNAANPGLGAVGVYGRGVTLLIAIPLPARIAYPLQDQLEKAAGAVSSAGGVAIGVGVLNLLLGQPEPGAGAWLVTGTVTADTLQRAIAALPPTDGFRR
jgi:hypothetical protein